MHLFSAPLTDVIVMEPAPPPQLDTLAVLLTAKPAVCADQPAFTGILHVQSASWRV